MLKHVLHVLLTMSRSGEISPNLQDIVREVIRQEEFKVASVSIQGTPYQYVLGVGVLHAGLTGDSGLARIYITNISY